MGRKIEFLNMPQHMFSTASPGVWLSLIKENGGRVPSNYWGRLAGILLISFATSPLSLVEKVRYGGVLNRTEINQPPLMILGHGRSGTTHLHNLLVCDPSFGSLSTFQAIMPAFSLIGRGWLKRALAAQLPGSRPMDNVEVGVDQPQEEEIAIANLSRLSSLHSLSFLRSWRWYHDRYTLMEGMNARDLAKWRNVYLNVVRKATVHAEGKRIVLKNTPNLARIPHLLELFPGSKYVNVVRNPYIVFESLKNMFKKITVDTRLQDIDEADIEEYILYAYRRNMSRYLEHRSLIPEGDLVEIKFEDLEVDPIGQMRRIYEALSLPYWELLEPRLVDYLERLGPYQKNRYEVKCETVQRVNDAWGFAVETWGYERSKTFE